MKKIVIITPAIDLDFPYGAIPYEWQLYKGLYEEGFDVIVTPYRGRVVRGLWWRCYENPCRREGDLFDFLVRNFPRSKRSWIKESGFTVKLAQNITRAKWERHLLDILAKEQDVMAVLFISIPLNHVKGLATKIKREHVIPIIYYDVDVPISLPAFGGFSFNSYIGGDPAEYDAFIIPSEDYVPVLREKGANKVFVLHFGVDPQLYMPIALKKDIDVFFSGNGSKGREEYLEKLISKPSSFLNKKFVVSGRNITINLGNATLIPMLPFNSFREYCCRTKIALNIARTPHATTHTSISRPFELASLQSCVLSMPYEGLNEWFTVGKEMLIAVDSKDATDAYNWLLDDEETRLRFGRAARQRVLDEHTIRHRVRQLLHFIEATA